MKQKSIRVEYTFPDLGDVEANLHKESKAVYDFLKSEKSGLEHFEKLDHLGKLRDVFKGAHHSRWEYLVLQLYLIDKLAESKGHGFSALVKLQDENEVSSVEELLKSWALLSNYGHLYGIFEAERAWFKILMLNADIRENFIRRLPSDKIRKKAEDIFRNESFNQFFYLVTAYLFNHRKKHAKRKRKEIFKLGIILLESLITVPTKGSTLERSIKLYRKIRRLCYVLLDLNFSTLFLRINPNLYIKRILKDAEAFLYNDESHLNKMLDSLEKSLFEEIYASPKATAYKKWYVDSQYNKFTNNYLNKGDIGLATQAKKLYELLMNAKVNDFGKSTFIGEYEHCFRLSIRPSDFGINRSRCKYFSEQNYFHKYLPLEESRVFITPLIYANNEGCFVDFFAKNRQNKIGALIIWRCIDYIYEIFEQWKSNEILFRYAIHTAPEQLMRYAIIRFIGGNYIIKFDKNSVVGEELVALIRSSSELAKWQRAQRDKIKRSTLSNDRKWELESLRQNIRKFGTGKFLVAQSSIQIFDQKGIRITEWDGVVIRILKGSIRIVIIEAKKRRTKAKQLASKKLENSLKKVKLNHGRIYTRQSNRSAVAYTTVEQ